MVVGILRYDAKQAIILATVSSGSAQLTRKTKIKGRRPKVWGIRMRYLHGRRREKEHVKPISNLASLLGLCPSKLNELESRDSGSLLPA